jgi:hypothetical protein
MKPRIMYIERSGGLGAGSDGDARIGRVSFSKTGRTLYDAGRSFRSLGGSGYKENYFDIESSEAYWILDPGRTATTRCIRSSCTSMTKSARSTGAPSATCLIWRMS